MKNAQPYYKLKQKVNNAIAGKIVVGHGLSHDFQALRINHSKSMQRDSGKDTNFYRKFERKFYKF
jgi:RNA exonuclease 4